MSTVSDPDTTRIHITELTQLDITSFQPRVQEPEVQETPDDSPADEESHIEEVVEAEAPAEVSTPQRIDLQDVLPEGVQVDLTVARTARNDVAVQDPVQSQPRALRIEETEMERIGGLQTLSGNNLSAPNAERASRNLESEGSIGLADGSEIGGGRRGSLNGGGGSLLGGPESRNAGRVGHEVGLRDLGDFGDEYSDMDPIINDLIAWMRENPSDLPVPVERRMEGGRWDDNNLTSRILFYIGDEQYDLLLMAKEEDLELHIFLVENKVDVTYLIDRGFRGESNSLRIGNVGYQDHDIAHVDSQMRPAGLQQTKEFYQIFLSWWENMDEG
ncbi:hypothetical protein QLX67_06470 [Balneolaceae bacterium ANBcel3]|nr:hypothetical protein [Balneolaceae bacterium ANBcel3]